MNRILRAASLVVTDRRWAAPLSAMALGFGLFIGVAIGPGASGTLATGVPQVIEIPSFSGGTNSGEGEGDGSSGAALARSATGGGRSGATALPSTVAPLSTYVEPPAAPLPTKQPSSPAPVPAGSTDEEPDEQEMSGTVVHVNPAAGSYAMALSGGELVAIHAAKLPKPGEKLRVPIRRLANGTLAEADRPERSGTAARATFNGAVTFLSTDPLAPAYTVSWLGASILIQAPIDPTGAVPVFPPIGSYVTVDVAIETQSPLRQHRLRVDEGPPSTYLELSGIYGGFSTETGQLLLSADGPRESGADLALAVPPEIDPARLRIGDSYLATATVEADGSLALAGIAGDERARGADDANSTQGDLRR